MASRDEQPIRPRGRLVPEARTAAGRAAPVEDAEPGSPWFALLLGFVTAVGGVNVVFMDEIVLTSLLVIAPALASIRLDGPRTALVSAYAAALALALSLMIGSFRNPTRGSAFVAVVVVGAISTGAAFDRWRRQRSFRQISRVAEVAQATIVRPIPAELGDLEFVTAYRSAAEEAQVGGDAYAAVLFPGGVRLLIADVRGKGLAAVGLAADVLAAFREAGPSGRSLPELVRSLEQSVRRALGPEDFVTALVAEFLAGQVRLVSCGHPWPLLVRGTTVTEISFDRPSPPLGLGVRPEVQTHPFRPGDRLLAFSDGLVEARDAAGEYFDPMVVLTEHAEAGPADLLDTLLGRLDRHTGGALTDDLAVVLVRRPNPRPALPDPAPDPAAEHAVAAENG